MLQKAGIIPEAMGYTAWGVFRSWDPGLSSRCHTAWVGQCSCSLLFGAVDVLSHVLDILVSSKAEVISLDTAQCEELSFLFKRQGR